MGYTHYYYTKSELNETDFNKVSTDFKKMVPIFKHLGIKLADGMGENTPLIRPDEIRFNGLSKCGHQQRELGITWAGKNAKGVLNNSVGTILADMTKESWFAGAMLESRLCDGDCSHETFSLEQKQDEDQVRNVEHGYIFNCTKTAFKPYDLAVQVCLVIAKNYFEENILVHSDGEQENWTEATQLVQHFLGYGENFILDTKSPEDLTPKKPKLMGDLAWVYKCPDMGDCTNKGLSSKYDKVMVCGVETAGVFEVNPEKDGVLYLHYSRAGIIATPNPDPNESYMFGGNFLYSSDSRFPGNGPIKIHDRREN